MQRYEKDVCEVLHFINVHTDFLLSNIAGSVKRLTVNFHHSGLLCAQVQTIVQTCMRKDALAGYLEDVDLRSFSHTGGMQNLR